MNVITMQGLFERDLVTGAGLVGSQTWPAPVTPARIECVRYCGNEAENPENSVFNLCADCADEVYHVFIAPALDTKDDAKIRDTYRWITKSYGR